MTQQTDQIQKTEVGKTIRNFRNASDIEGFYRFLSDNNLRREARMVLGVVVNGMKKISTRRKNKKKRNRKKLQQ